jgi:cell division protein FtsL
LKARVTLGYFLRDKDNDYVAGIVKDYAAVLLLKLYSVLKNKGNEDNEWLEIRIEETGEIKPEDIERVTSRRLRLKIACFE